MQLPPSPQLLVRNSMKLFDWIFTFFSRKPVNTDFYTKKKIPIFTSNESNFSKLLWKPTPKDSFKHIYEQVCQ